MGIEDTVKKNIVFAAKVTGKKQLNQFTDKMRETGNVVRKQGRNWSAATKTMARNRRQANALVKQYDSLSGSLGMSQENFIAVNKYSKGFNTILGRLGNSVRMATHGMRGFRMEMLGVMFFGMMLQKALTGLLRPVMEVYGMFDLWRIMLMIFFLPIMEELFPYFLKLIQYFIDLDPPIQKMIGGLVILGIIVGFFLFLLGSFALGIGSVILALGPLGMGILKAGAAMTFLKGVFAGIGVAFGVVAVIILAILLGMWLAWKEGFADMDDWFEVWVDGIKQYLTGLKNIIKGILKIIVSMFKGDFEGVKDGIELIVDGIKDMFIGLFKMVISGVTMIGIGVLRAMVAVKDALVTLWKGFFSWMFDIMVDWSVMLVGVFAKVIRKVASLISLMAKVPGFGSLSGVASKLRAGADMLETTAPGAGEFMKEHGFFGTLDAARGGTSVVSNTTYNITVSDTAEMERMLEEHERKNIDNLTRLVTVPG